MQRKGTQTKHANNFHSTYCMAQLNTPHIKKKKKRSDYSSKTSLQPLSTFSFFIASEMYEKRSMSPLAVSSVLKLLDRKQVFCLYRLREGTDQISVVYIHWIQQYDQYNNFLDQYLLKLEMVSGLGMGVLAHIWMHGNTTVCDILFLLSCSYWL